VTGLAQGATFNVSVADGSFAKTYVATVGAGGVWTATIPTTDAENLPNGTATVSAQVTDQFGNQSAVATQSVTVAETLPTVTIAPVDGNDVINNAEANAGVPLNGTVTGLAQGATFNVSVADGSFAKTYVATVGAGGVWTATIPTTDAENLPNGTATVSAQVTDQFGNQSALASQTVTVAETLPTVTIAPVDGNDVINNVEAHVGVQLTGNVTGLAQGATFNVSVADGSFAKTYVATVGAGGVWTATIPSTDAVTLPNGTATVSAQVTDQFGNQSAIATQSVMVNEAQQATVTIDEVNGNNVINSAEAHAASAQIVSGTVTGLAAGETFTLAVTDGTFSQNYVATVDSAGTGWSADIPSADLLKLPNGQATFTAEVSLSVTASEIVAVAEILPTVTIDKVDGNDVINFAEAHATSGVLLTGSVTGLAAGATFSVSVKDGALSKSYIATVNSAATGWTATIPSSDAITLPNGTATVSAQITDQFGNQSAVATQAVTVAEALPTVTINEINGDDIINNVNATSYCDSGQQYDSGRQGSVGGGKDGGYQGHDYKDRGYEDHDHKAGDNEDHDYKVGDDNKNDRQQGSAVLLSGSVSGIAPGSTFTVTVTDGGFSKSYIATVNSVGNGWTASIPASDIGNLPDGTATFTTQVTDQFGNQSAPATQLVKVEGAPPQVLSVTASPKSGDLYAGMKATITLVLNDAVKVAGSPALILNDGGIATYDKAHSTATALTFDYIVTAGQRTSDLRISGLELPTGASIQDIAGNNLVPSSVAADLKLGVNARYSSTSAPTFTEGTSGKLRPDSASYSTGKISGSRGHDEIDLVNIGFGAHTTLGYAQTPGYAGGTLMISDGAHTAKLALLGQYVASSFPLASDGHGGTLISDPSHTAHPLLSSSHG